MDDFVEELDLNQADYEFAIGKRQYKKQTKEERIYGIWAEEDDDDELRPSFGAGQKRPNDSAPVRFISGGVKSDSSKEQLPNEILEQRDEEIIVEARPEKRSKTTFASQFKQKEVGSQLFAGLQGFASTSAGASADSAWSRSGKGNVIMQMMQKMGYEQGKGLGKSKQGIVEPVKAVLRPGRGAVGAYGSEAKGPKFGESAAEAQTRIQSTDESGSSFIQTEINQTKSTWKKGTANRVKIQYKTLNEVISEGQSQFYSGSIMANSSIGKIIDMTGPEQKVYEDFSSFSRRVRRPIGGEGERAQFNMPELTHNLNTLLDVTEEEIFKTDKQIRYLKDQNEILVCEEKRIELELKDNQDEIDRIGNIESIIKRFYQSQVDGSLDECKELFITLRSEYAAEYTLYGLEAIAIPLLLPKIKAYFTNWSPLDPELISFGFSMLSEWKDILGNAKGGSLLKHFNKDRNVAISAYDHCIWSGWMPSVRRAALNWNPRTNSPVMVSLLQIWLPILPNWIVENIFEQVLVPKIKSQVDEWDPVTDPIPIESWLLPWHSLMGDRLLATYATLRQKLTKGLRSWYPGDRSAFESIRPWKDIFSSSIMHAFICMNIIPKLEMALQKIDITNTEQFDYLEIFDWLEMINTNVICQALVKSFFPRYYQQLCHQLNSPKLTIPELDKIKRDYMDWKNLMPQEVQRHELVMGELKRVLMAIGQVQSQLTGVSLLPSIPNPSAATPSISQYQQVPHHAPSSTQFTAQLPPSSFKQLVETSAISKGIQFFPQRSKFQDGKQVYMFGDHSVYFDGTMLYFYNPTRRQWLPASLNQMIEMSRTR